jgi:hypothetical protein
MPYTKAKCDSYEPPAIWKRENERSDGEFAASRNQCRVTDLDSGNVSDGVEWTWRSTDLRGNAELAGARLLSRERGGCYQQ